MPKRKAMSAIEQLVGSLPSAKVEAVKRELLHHAAVATREPGYVEDKFTDALRQLDTRPELMNDLNPEMTVIVECELEAARQPAR